VPAGREALDGRPDRVEGHTGGLAEGDGREYVLDVVQAAQAQRLAERMKRSPPTAIFASDLERAAETARYIGEACGLPVTLDPALREVDVGLWTGKGYEEVHALYPEEWAAWDSGLDVRRGGGETYAELAARVNLSTHRLSRLFKLQMGTRLVEFRNRQRLQRFLLELGDGETRNLLGLALEVGFGSYTQFNRVFKRVMGCSPAQYQRQKIAHITRD